MQKAHQIGAKRQSPNPRIGNYLASMLYKLQLPNNSLAVNLASGAHSITSLSEAPS